MLAVLLVYVTNLIVTGNTQNVRLNNTLNNGLREGRLEIYFSQRWGTVCYHGFTNFSARVACASLGFGYVGAAIGNQYGAGADPIWLDNVNCTGTEIGIGQCAHLPWGQSNCVHSEDVSIRCGCDNEYLSGSTGQISSPDFPMNYGNNVNCSSIISFTYEQTIIITFLAFRTEFNYDFVTITCEMGTAFRSPSYSGQDFPVVLTISSCSRVKVSFRSDSSVTFAGFSLTYTITSDTVKGGVTIKPSLAFPRSNKIDPIIFNCTSKTKYLPWWNVNGVPNLVNATITNLTCGVITSTPYTYWFTSETLGPGSCNLIVTGYDLRLLAGSLVCTDSTLTPRRAILAPINLELMFTKGVNSSATVTDLIRDEEIKISCKPSFTSWYLSPSVFTYFHYSGSKVVMLRILRTYWTSLGNVVPSTDTSNTSSYVLVKAPAVRIPSYACNIVFDFFSNISDASGDSSVEISFNTESVEVLYWPTEDSMTITGDNNGQIRIPALLNCFAAANPPATYTWTDESNGNITNGPTIIVNHGGKYTCNASNIIRGKYYGQSKSVNLQVTGDDTNRLKLIAIILGALLAAAVLTIIIILVILIIRRFRQQKPNTGSDVGHTNLRQIREETNRYEPGPENIVDIANTEYANLGATSRRIPSIYPDFYEELHHQQ